MHFNKSALKLLIPANLALLAFASSPAPAQLIAVGPFTGTVSETFESFQNYNVNPLSYEAEPISTFGGGATLTSGFADIGIYSPSNGADFGLGLNGNAAQVADGVNGAALDNTDTATFMFATDVRQFGGYFGATSFGGAAPISFSFYDDNNVLIGTETYNYDHTATGDGVLDFVGYASPTNVKTITISGDYIVFDGLQANAAVPEPGFIALLTGLSLTGAAFLRRRKTRA